MRRAFAPVTVTLASLVLLAAAAGACNREPGEAPATNAAAGNAPNGAQPPQAGAAAAAPATPPVAAAAADPASAAPATFGEKISATDTVKLSDIAKNPGSFKGKAIATTGTVTAVCQERGCWMALKDDGGGTATVRMHGHSFFVPRSSSGKHARVQGSVVLVKDGKECDDMTAQGAELELDATGVELL